MYVQFGKGSPEGGTGAASLPDLSPRSVPNRTVPSLTSKQRAHLRGLAHALKPIAHVGKDGVTPAALRALQQTFETHELVKVRVLEAAPEGARETGHALAAGVDGAEVVQTVGRTVTIYRADPETPTIRLP